MVRTNVSNMPIKHDDISFSVINEQDISAAMDQAIREGLVACFPADREYYQHQSWWHCVPAFRVLGTNDKGSVVAHTAVVERTITIGPNLAKMRIAGIQSFCVLPDYRGTGLSDKVMSIAMDEANSRGFEAGLLFCLGQLEKVYRRMGWTKIDVAAYMTDEKKNKISILTKNITMFYPLNKRELPTGDIDLAGTDW